MTGKSEPSVKKVKRSSRPRNGKRANDERRRAGEAEHQQRGRKHDDMLLPVCRQNALERSTSV